MQQSDGVKVKNTAPSTQVIHPVLICHLVQQNKEMGEPNIIDHREQNSTIEALRSQILSNLSLPAVTVLKQFLLVVQQFLYVV